MKRVGHDAYATEYEADVDVLTITFEHPREMEYGLAGAVDDGVLVGRDAHGRIRMLRLLDFRASSEERRARIREFVSGFGVTRLDFSRDETR